MEQLNQLNLDRFLYPRRPYHGQVKPQDLVFNANLQEFAQRVSYITNLQTRGKLSVQESYHQVNALWEQLQSSYWTLGIEPDAD
ncbi:MAG TPA: hypothetical protein DCE56_26720 [Cyanobacteria bacterium UBA8553]|nr:hypothetical protein [Cyanobacteria bacterium UBA8553]HAJ64014.1 hypothetical protein [Cyanobacteria bacterium UBA8543]